MKKPLRVFVADPCFDEKGLSTPVIPLGAGLVASYAKKQNPSIDIEVFKGITPLVKKLDKSPPDILGITCYIWNKNLALAIANHAKKSNPDILIVFGGPEIDSKPDNVNIFAKKYNVVDIFVQHEGEIALSNIITEFINSDYKKTQLIESILKLGNCFIINNSNKILQGPNLPRIEALDDIPSPYVMGLLDKFLSDEAYMPMIQTNRGCPFSCTFCQEGESYFTKVKRHSLEFIVEELNYIAKYAKSTGGLWITDSNWAMYKWDEDIADHIAYLQSTVGWPSEIISSTGKANLDRIIRITKKLNNTMYISNSVQSMNADVLKDIKRKNLSNIELEKHREHLRGIRQEPEIIVPLPNETKKSFFNGINELLDSGPNQRFAVFQTMILTNTVMAHGTSIEKFGLNIKYKQHFNLIGRVGENFVCETERVVTGTNTLSTEDFLDCRVYAMLLDTILRFEPIREVFHFLDSVSISYSTFAMALYKSIGSAPADIKSCFNNFKNDLIDEMHDTEDAVIKYMEENEENYKYGRKGGGNLRYSNMLWINCFQNNFDWIFSTLYSILKKDADQVFQAKNIEKYLYHLYLDRLEPSAGETISVTFDYSLLDWAEKEKITPLSDFAGDTTYEFLKTEISDIDKLSIWQDFGFKLDKKKSPKPAGYQNKLFISRLRRSIKCLDNKYGTKNKNYSKQENKVGKLAL